MDTPAHEQYNEVPTILQHAQNVDNDWVLTRKNCESLCVNYQIVVELTQKYYLRRWTPNGHHLKTHKLVELAKEIERVNIRQHVIASFPRYSLEFVTQCGEHTKYKGIRIVCTTFYGHTEVVDPYVASLWNVMKNHTAIRN